MMTILILLGNQYEMNSLRTLLVLLVFFTSTAVAKHPKDVVKNVAKRFRSRTRFYQRFSWEDQDMKTQIARRDEYTEQIAKMIHEQSSEQNEWQVPAQKLESLMHSNFEGSICGSAKINYIDWMKYWNRQRTQFNRNYKVDGDNTYIWQDNTNSTVYIRFVVSFMQHSKFGYAEKTYYEVTAEVETENGRPIKNYNPYIIMKIAEKGTCADYGTADWKMVPNARLKIKENDSEEGKKVQAFLEKHFHVGQAINTIPSEWINTFTSRDGKSLYTNVCHDNKPMIFKKIKFARWWMKFQLMWHPVVNSTDHTKITYISGSPGTHYFRLTMRLQIGVKPKSKVHDINIKLRVIYNQHGDHQWYIDRIEVLCPFDVDENLMAIHASAIQESIGVRLGLMAQSPEQWYYVAHFLDPFITTDKIDIKTCAELSTSIFWSNKMTSATNIRDIDYTFWQKYKDYNMKLVGYEIENYVFGGPSAEKKTWMDIRVYFTPQEYNTIHYSIWKFEVEWDDEFQFYHIISVIFACPMEETGSRAYQIAQRKECIFKICSFIPYDLPDKVDYDDLAYSSLG